MIDSYERLAAVFFGGVMARLFKPKVQQTVIVIGADEVGRLFASILGQAGESVLLLDIDAERCTQAKELRGVQVICADPADPETLRRVGAEDTRWLFAMTPDDETNLLVCQVARALFAVPRLVARANPASDPNRFKAQQIELMSPARAAAAVLERTTAQRVELLPLVEAAEGLEQMADIEVLSPAHIGQPLENIPLGGCFVVALQRDGQVIVPRGSTGLQMGDVLTLLGSAEEINRAREQLWLCGQC
jgi:Trk K+ transport system NAD-binding subunit